MQGFFSFICNYIRERQVDSEFNSSARCSETDDCLIYAWPPCCCSAFRWKSSENNTFNSPFSWLLVSRLHSLPESFPQSSFSRPHSSPGLSTREKWVKSATVIRLAVRLHIYGSRQVGLWPKYSVKQHLYILQVFRAVVPVIKCPAKLPFVMWRKSR